MRERLPERNISTGRDNSPTMFIPRHELLPHLQKAQVVLTRGGKLSAQGIRVGHLPIGAIDGISVPRNRMRLNGELRIFNHTKHLEAHVRDAFERAFTNIVRERSEAEARKQELADATFGSEIKKSFRELKDIASGAWNKIASVMTGGGEVQEDQSQE